MRLVTEHQKKYVTEHLTKVYRVEGSEANYPTAWDAYYNLATMRYLGKHDDLYKKDRLQVHKVITRYAYLLMKKDLA